jgi:hypothetical protein
MPFRALIISVFILSGFSDAHARKPAVEDFVGVEVEQVESTGNGPLVNLENDLQKIEIVQATAPMVIEVKAPEGRVQVESTSWSTTALIALIFILALPVVAYLIVVGHLRQKASIEAKSNVELLEKYRKEREKTRRQEEEQRKAS